MRDDFSQQVKRTLADRVAWKCCFPGCGEVSIGPGNKDDNHVVRLGVAAHITAAASGGPRYNSDITPVERSSIKNAIWLCTKHGDLIDKDFSEYSAETLRQWKAQAEEKANNNDVGGRKFEMADMAYIIRGLGYLKSKEDVENIALNNYKGIPVRVKDIGSVQMGGELRLGIFDIDGKGVVVGGIVVMRYGENANKVIAAVKEKMKEVEKGLPEGVAFKTSYDRSTLIQEAVQSVKGTLIEEMIAVSIVVLIFLFHWRSALIILIQLPISVAAGFIFLQMFGISSNIMSLTGIALAIGVVVDDGIVMVENAYRHISEAQTKKLDSSINPDHGKVV